MEVGHNEKQKIGRVRPWTLVLLVVVTVIGGGPIIFGCDSSDQNWRPWEERNNMELARGHSSHRVTIPPIDIEAPENTEMATFALG